MSDIDICSVVSDLVADTVAEPVSDPDPVPDEKEQDPFELFGEFRNTVMLQSEMEQYGGLLWTQNMPYSYVPYRRSGDNTFGMSQMEKFLQCISDGNQHTLEIDTRTHKVCIFANTTLAKEKLRDGQNFLWHFRHKETGKSGWNGKGASRVRAIYRMPMGEIFFLCEGMKIPPGKQLGNFCHPEFLNSTSHEEKNSFERLNSVVEIEKRTASVDDHQVIGVAAIMSTEQPLLYRPIIVILDGVQHVIAFI